MHIYINTIEKSRTAISIYLSHFYPKKLFTCTNKVIRDLANMSLITTITEDTRETIFLFQRLSMALQRGNAVSFHNSIVTE